MVRRRRLADPDKSESYKVPDQVCATCLQSTRRSYHEQCRRDRSGRLLVLDGRRSGA